MHERRRRLCLSAEEESRGFVTRATHTTPPTPRKQTNQTPIQQPKQNNPPEKQNSAFAPNDDAVAAAAKALGTTKLGLRELPNLADILKYHVVAGTVLSGDLKDGQEVETIGGKKFKVTIAGGVPSVNGIKVTKKDIKVSNGIIHALSGVLVPQ